MEQRIYNEHTGINCTLQGDCYLPDFVLPEQEDKLIGLWGQRRLRYIKQHKKIFYIKERESIFEEKRGEIREILRKLCQWKGVDTTEGEAYKDHIF